MHKYRELHPRKVYAEEKLPEVAIPSTEVTESSPSIDVNIHPITGEIPTNEQITVPDIHENENVTGDAPVEDHRDLPWDPKAQSTEEISTTPGPIENISEWVDEPHVEIALENPTEATIPTWDDQDWAINLVPESSTEVALEIETIENPPRMDALAIPLEITEATPPKEEIEGAKEEKKEPKKKSLSPEKKEKVIEIINNAKTLIARWHIDDARTLIVNGLSLEKHNRELNLLMAGLYEREHAFEKAEFILKELAEADSDDVEVLTHLATVVAMQRKFEVSYEIYKKVLTLAWETEETLYTLAHIASELGLTDDVYSYSKSYLKQFPKNPEILWLYSQSQIAKGERKWAIETLIKLKNLTPYNQEIVDLISKLVTEDELAGNFGESWNN